MTEKSMHGYDAVFVPTLDKKYSCPVCLAALRDPVQTSCGHRFCQACLKMSFCNKKKGRCPVDKKWCNISTDVFLDVAVKREVLSLEVKCYNHTKECEWQGELRDLKSHAEHCPQADVNCDMCRAVMLRRELEDHQFTCPQRLENCPHCGVPVIYIDMPKHQLLVCSKFPVNCVICCETGILREDIPKHVDTTEGDCPLVTVPCKFQHIGCYFQDKRKNMGSHYESAIEHHMMLLSMKVAENEETIQHQDRQIKEITDEMRELNNTVQEQNRMIKSQNQLLSIQQSKFLEQQQINHSGSLLWKITLAQNRGKKVESPSFYTGCPGYKVKIIFNLGSSYTENNKTYTSLFLHLEHGLYDKDLAFPFEARCAVNFLNKDLVKDVQKAVCFKAQGKFRSDNNDAQDSILVGKKLKFFSLSDLPQDKDILLEVNVSHMICSY